MWGLLFSFLILNACNYRIDKSPDNSNALEKLAEKPDSLSYSVIKHYIFDAKCMACHSGGSINLDSYKLVKDRIIEIKKVATESLTMPPKAPLSSAEIRVLRTWIQMGAPEFAKDPVEIPEEPLEPSFTSIQKNILNKRCLACHSPNGSADHIPLVSYNDLINSPREIVIPENPEESGIIIAIKRTDDKRMPPPETGSQLTTNEIQIIEKWILDGAKP